MAQQSSEQIVPLHFPRGGVDRSQAFDRQPVRPTAATGYSHTTPWAVNVMTYEPGTLRARGGSRPGIGLFCTNQVNSSNPIQDINVIIETGLITGGVGGVPGWGTTSTTIYGRTKEGVLKSNGGPSVWNFNVSSQATNCTVAAIGNYVMVIQGTSSSPYKWVIVKDGNQIASGNIVTSADGESISICEDGTHFYVTWLNPAAQTYGALKITTTGTIDASDTSMGSNIDVPNSRLSTSIVDGGIIYTCFRREGIFKTTTTIVEDGTLITQADLTAAAGSNWAIDDGYTMTGAVTVTPKQMALAGNIIAIVMRNVATTFIFGTRILAYADTANRFKVVYVNRTTGAVAFTSAAFGALAAGEYQIAALETDGTHFYLLVGSALSVAAGVNNFVVKLNGTTGATMWTSASFGAAVYNLVYSSSETKIHVSGPSFSTSINAATGVINSAGLGTGIVSFHDAGLVETLSSNVMDEGAVANGSNYNRALVPIACAGGTLKIHYQSTWQPVTSDGGTIASTVKAVRSAVLGPKVFYVDGTNYSYYDIALNKHKAWTATDGTMPLDSTNKKAKLICRWRGRIVLAGFPSEGGKFHMSKQTDGFDWNTAPSSSTPIQAVASTMAHLGAVADTITCLIPYSDDTLVMGGNSSIWWITGDPMLGGRLARISEGIGIAWGNAWCTDPVGNVYFVSNTGGVYTMIPGQQPLRVSGAIDDLLDQITIDEVLIRMAWHHQWQGIVITVTHVDGAMPNTHFFWEQRTGSWWPIKFADDDHNPLCMCVYDGPTASTRTILIGSFDGYVRYLSTNLTSDDGTDIETEVYLGPYLTPNLDDVMLKEMVVVMGTESGPVDYEIKVGETAEEAFASDAVDEGELIAGRNYNKYVRRSGHAVYCRLTSSVRWSMETIALVTMTQGTVRRRGR
jgi:hypothetical protein